MVDAAPCPFCTIITGGDASARLVYRSEKVTVFFPLDPATRGHTLVVPNRHVADFTDLTAAESRDLGEAVHQTARAIRSALSPDGLNVIQSTGASATQTVPHVHFHVVPRWHNDRMILSWPTGPAENDSAQDETLIAIQRVFPGEDDVASAEDRRQHLSFIQAVITRMSQASSSSKAWLLPIVSLTYGYAITNKSVLVGLIGCLAVLVFGVLDANYLKQERAFRKLYDEVASGRPIPAFAMNPALASSSGARVNYWPDKPDFRSWAVAPVYLPLILAGLGIVVWLLYI
ncbi:HIT family protein [Streptomyces sp. WMMB303]|uniref:HIT family protein n=1 Tax=Streptomyces sp. WMMB303 TaxID=3034154 RepID=UPI0023ED19C0|nr:HIT family protein [Streptomyces sp. WMMB303]MDF4254374.1 HIT family protein [Streptomyces sp. WMMB303]